MAKRNVVGVGVGFRHLGRRMTDEIAVVTLVREKIAQAGLTCGALVPREVDRRSHRRGGSGRNSRSVASPVRT